VALASLPPNPDRSQHIIPPKRLLGLLKHLAGPPNPTPQFLSQFGPPPAVIYATKLNPTSLQPTRLKQVRGPVHRLHLTGQLPSPIPQLLLNLLPQGQNVRPGPVQGRHPIQVGHSIPQPASLPMQARPSQQRPHQLIPKSLSTRILCQVCLADHREGVVDPSLTECLLGGGETDE